DVLSFYNRLIANDSYLATASDGAVAGLVELIGYKPRPAIAAVGTVAVIRLASDVSEPLVIPNGLQLSSTPTAGISPQTFEVTLQPPLTSAPFVGPSAPSVIIQGIPALQTPHATDDLIKSVLLAERSVHLTAGTEVLLIGRNWEGKSRDWAVAATAAVIE